jgi:hypothetical protein
MGYFYDNYKWDKIDYVILGIAIGILIMYFIR